MVSGLVELTSGCSSFAKTLRLMAGHELATEGFAKGQTGSSAMPHKIPPQSGAGSVGHGRVANAPSTKPDKKRSMRDGFLAIY